MSGGLRRVTGNGGPQPISPLLLLRPDDPDWSNGHHLTTKDTKSTKGSENKTLDARFSVWSR